MLGSGESAELLLTTEGRILLISLQRGMRGARDPLATRPTICHGALEDCESLGMLPPLSHISCYVRLASSGIGIPSHDTCSLARSLALSLSLMIMDPIQPFLHRLSRWLSDDLMQQTCNIAPLPPQQGPQCNEVGQ